LFQTLNQEELILQDRDGIMESFHQSLLAYLSLTQRVDHALLLRRVQKLTIYLQELVGATTELTTTLNLLDDTLSRCDIQDFSEYLWQYILTVLRIFGEVIDHPKNYNNQVKVLLREHHKQLLFSNPHILNNNEKAPEKNLSIKHVIQESIKGICHLSWQIFHRHVNLGNDNDKTFYLPHNIKSVIVHSGVFSGIQERNSEQYKIFHSLFSWQPLQGGMCSKDDALRLIELLAYVACVMLRRGFDSNSGAITRSDMISWLLAPLKKHLPQYNRLLKRVTSRGSFENLHQDIVSHIEKTDKLLQLIYASPSQKQTLTQQLISWLLRMEVDDPDLTQDCLAWTYGKDFVIDETLHATLKKSHVSLMDFTIDMLDLDDRDSKVLIYAMLCPKVTGDNPHPVASPDQLYIISWNDLSTLTLTPKWLAYFSRAFNAWVDWHFQDTYNIPASSLVMPSQLAALWIEWWIGYPFTFHSIDDIIAILRWSAKLCDYDKANISDYMASSRCFLHIAWWHNLNIQRINSLNITSWYAQLFSLNPMRQKKVSSFVEGDFKKLQLKDTEWSLISFAAWENPNDTSWYFDNVIMSPRIQWSFSWRVKTLDSFVRKMRNDAKYKHAKYVGDVVACRYEIDGATSSSSECEQILEIWGKFFKRLYGSPESSPVGFAKVSLKWPKLLAYVRDFLALPTTNRTQKLSERWVGWTYWPHFITVLQTAYEDASALQGKYANTKTASWLEELKFVTQEWTEYQIMMRWWENTGYLHHMFYDLKKFVNDKLRVNNFTHWSQLKRAATTQLVRWTSHSVSQLQQTFPETFVNKSYVTYAFKRLLLDQIKFERLSSLLPKENIEWVIHERLQLTHTSILQYYNDAALFHTDPITNERILHNKISTMDKEILWLMIHEARKQVDYMLDNKRFWSTSIDTNILDAYIDIFYKNSTYPTSE
jgi:hypothetical protein